MTLKAKAIQGAFWVATAMAAGHILSFVVTIILARLLTPNDFGLIAIANIVLHTVEILKDMGLTQALIYKSQDLERVANTTFILSIGSGFLAFLVAILCAPLVTLFFQEPNATSLIQVLAISLIFSAFIKVPHTILIIQLDFKRKFLTDILPSFGYALMAIGLAGLGIGAWSIVLGKLFEILIRTGLVWLLVKWRPKFHFETSIAKEIIIYGKDIALSSILAVLFLNIDNAFISRILNATELGYYIFAFSLATFPVLFAQRVVDTVNFPVYSQIREQLPTLRNAYLKSLRLIAMLVFPTNLGLLAIAPILVPVLYGEKWRPSIILIQILSLYGISRAMANSPTTLLMAVGKQHLFPRFTLLFLILSALGLTPAIYWQGTLGAAIIMTVVIWTGAFTWFSFCNQHLSLPINNTIQAVFPSILSAIFMVIVVKSTTKFLNETIYSLILIIAIGVISYISCLIVITRGRVLDDIREVIYPIIHKQFSSSHT